MILNIKVTYKIGNGAWIKKYFIPTQILGYKSSTISFGALADFPTYESFIVVLRNTIRKAENISDQELIEIGNIEFFAN